MKQFQNNFTKQLQFYIQFHIFKTFDTLLKINNIKIFCTTATLYLR